MPLQLDNADRGAAGGRLPIGVLTVTASAVILCLLLLIGILNSRAQFTQAEQRVADQARTLAEHTARTFGSVDLILRQLVRNIESRTPTISGPALKVGPMLQTARDDLPHIRNLLFLDARGRTVAGVLPTGQSPSDLAARPFFVAHQRNQLGASSPASLS